ncbi:MAG: non-ribosomal peptide synthetase, partial [bacterium]|nr:non-ribosomal peptide synthetase [bacterium]
AAGENENNLNFFSEYDYGTKEETQKENYYLKTKLEAEKLVLEAREKGIHTNIIRVGNLVFHSQTGTFQKNIEDNAFYAILKSLIKLKRFPEMKAQNVEFSFVDYTAEAVTLLFSRKEFKNQNYHVRNPYHLNYPGLVELIKTTRYRQEIPLDIIPGLEFLDFLKNNYHDTLYSEYIKTLVLHTGLLE